jgi:L-rhamnose mutarotase
MKRYCYALDLTPDPSLIEEYEEHHRKVWPEVLDSIRQSGILSMEIFRVENRLFMVMETEDNYDPEMKSQKDAENPKVQEWEQLMWHYQQALPGSSPGQKWREARLVFSL